MTGVNPNRIRWGACAWLLTLQFFVVETIAQVRFEGSYSRVDDVISTLGTAESAARQLMNASFVLQGALIVAGALLLRPALRSGAGRVAEVLLVAAAVGTLVVGVFPSDANETLHGTGAVLYLAGGGLGLIALAYALRPRSEAVGTTLALLGLIGTGMTVFFVTGVTRYLGEGGTERAAAYVLPFGLALAGVALWRLTSTPADRGSQPQERVQAGAEQADRDRARDQALEAAAPGTAGEPGTAAAPDVDDDEGNRDADDPWAAPSRRRRD